MKEIAFSKMVAKFGAGADGLLVLERSKKANFKMRIFNPDGTEPNMCGNGARCVALFYASCNKKVKFETRAGIIEAEVKGDNVRIRLTDPKELWANIDLNIGSQFYKVHYVNTGVPHTVFFVGNVDTINVKEVGKNIRHHKQFQPEGTNANFVQVINPRAIKIRTYERG
ncbi:MAG: diaminopimelate epimerase, partial [Candidatus Omnitrophica bacterium]|nr:diaminopimelate epimerase [Candidatus Omnitrophota bacterium]